MPSSKCIRAERKRQIEKGSEQSRKDFFVKRTPNHINNNKSNAHENNNSDNKSCSNGGLWNNNQMAYIVVPNQYRKKVTGHNHRLMLISF